MLKKMLAVILMALCFNLFERSATAQGGWDAWDIFLRDGTQRRASPLSSLDNERFSTSLKNDASPSDYPGKVIARSKIDYIARRSRLLYKPEMPPAPTDKVDQDLVVMMDGRRTSGAVTLKSIRFSDGTIIQNNVEIEMTDVAYIKFAAPTAATRQPARRPRKSGGSVIRRRG